MVEARLFASKSAPELLEEFRVTGAQAPFEEVVRRYAGMVYSVCLRVTKNSHDAEDATQAVFLALAVQGKTAKPVRYIGPWLQQVAHRLSLDIRRSRKRQKAREEKVGEMMRSTHGPNGTNGNGRHAPDAVYEEDELKRLINDEINQLPSKYRLPLILHYFGGLTREEMAKELNVRPNTLGVRVYRGRELLGKRLAQRGLSINTGALSLMLAGSISLRFNESLITSTCGAVAAATGGMGGGPEVIASVFANQVFGVTRAIARGMTLAKIKVVAAMAIAIGTAVAGGAEMVTRITPLDLRFSLPTDLASRLRDTLRSFIRPLQFSISPTTSDHLLGGETLGEDDDDSMRYAGNSEPYDPLAQHYFHGEWSGPTILSLPDHPTRGTHAASSSPHIASSASLTQGPERANVVQSSSSTSAGHAVAGAVAPVGAGPTSGSGLPQVHSLASAGFGPRTVAPQRVALLNVPVAPPVVVIGATPGLHQTHVVRSGESQHFGGLTVGDLGSATFRQTGGSTRIDNDLTVARSSGSTGEVELSGGSMTTGGNQFIGLQGSGRFTQTGGANLINGSLVVGHEGAGHYAMHAGTLTADTLKVAYTGKGDFTHGLDRAQVATAIGGSTPVFDPVSRFNAVTVADKQGSEGKITLNAGDLFGASQTIGRAGDGSVIQQGGTNTAQSLWLGSARQSIGSYVLNDGVLKLDPGAGTSSDDSGITVGGAGAGSFHMGAANRAARIVEAQAGTNLAIRAKPSGSGLFQGWGSVGLSGLVVNNGRIVADGYGSAQSLDLSTAVGVTNTIENPVFGGANGWFAQRGGMLVLPGIDVAAGSNAYSWGEDPNDALPDLVNSVRLYVRDAAGSGEIDISLLALDRSDIPTLPAGHDFIGVWRFDAKGLDFGGVDLAVRYDDALAQSKGLSESVLKLWQYESGQWSRIDDDSFRRYAALNILSGYAGSDLTHFAVSAPEPTCLGALALSGWMLMRRRRK